MKFDKEPAAQALRRYADEDRTLTSFFCDHQISFRNFYNWVKNPGAWRDAHDYYRAKMHDNALKRIECSEDPHELKKAECLAKFRYHLHRPLVDFGGSKLDCVQAIQEAVDSGAIESKDADSLMSLLSSQSQLVDLEDVKARIAELTKEIGGDNALGSTA